MIKHQHVQQSFIRSAHVHMNSSVLDAIGTLERGDVVDGLMFLTLPHSPLQTHVAL
jgi:hypothetical protein